MQNQVTGLGRLAPVAVGIALAVVAALLSAPATAQATSVATTRAAEVSHHAGVVTAATTADRRKRRFTPKAGVIVTNPLGTSKKRIMNHILKSIRATPRGQKIRLISWNIASRGFVNTLINAHDRGVSVRVLMSKQKAQDQPRDGDFWRLKRQLRQRNGQPKKLRSWARGCDRSCRGRRGIAHSKLFIFSKVGRARRVVMSTSANATDVSVYRQWNDLYTNTGSKSVYRGFMSTFRQAAKDHRVRRGYRTFKGKSVTGYVYPWAGPKARGDRVKNTLRRIHCNGARGRTGVRGHTRVRIAQDAIIDKRGKSIAKILRHKWESGCNIKIVYALMNNHARYILKHTRRGPVPMRQIVQDWDGDGVYDRYLHAKVLAVSGHYRKNHKARVSWQGSENWSGLAKISDEQGFQIRRRGAERRYTNWIDWMFANPPVKTTTRRATLRTAAARGVDPYALIKEELGIPVDRG